MPEQNKENKTKTVKKEKTLEEIVKKRVEEQFEALLNIEIESVATAEIR